MSTTETDETSTISASGESIESTTFSESDELTSDDQSDLESDVESVETESKSEEDVEDEEDDDLMTWDGTDTAIEKGVPRRKENKIQSYGCRRQALPADEIYKAFGIEPWYRVKPGNLTAMNDVEEQKMDTDGGPPSMWDYDKSCLPKEFVDLDPTTFLMDPSNSKSNLCLLTTKILARICAMLTPLDFVNLSLTCRYLHWRMFSFCTCYAPNCVQMDIYDSELPPPTSGRSTMPDIVYYNYLHGTPLVGAARLYRGYRCVVIYKPTCLKRPFFFETLELCLNLPCFNKAEYDRYLPHVMVVRNRANCLFLRIFSRYDRDIYNEKLISLTAVNDFFKAVKATVYQAGNGFFRYGFCDLYVGCPYIQQMDEVRVDFDYRDTELPLFQNRIGYYGQPPTGAVKRTLEGIFRGSTDLDFHVYYNLEEDGQALIDTQVFPTLKYLFNRYDFDEYYSDQFRHVWYATVSLKSGKKYKMRISKMPKWDDDVEDRMEFYAGLMIGKAEIFDKMEGECMSLRAYRNMLGIFCACHSRKREKKGWWRMKTAVEPDEEKQRENGPVDEGNTIKNE